MVRTAVVVVGEQVRIAGYALAGARLLVAEEPDDVRRQWAAIGDDVAVVVLTSVAADALDDPVTTRPDLLTVVMP